MTEYNYQAHVVTDLQYGRIILGDSFKDGIVVEGCAGLENDCLIITAHAKLPQLEDRRGKDVER